MRKRLGFLFFFFISAVAACRVKARIISVEYSSFIITCHVDSEKLFGVTLWRK